MNEQFSMLYSILFLTAIIGSFSALKAGVNYWADYEFFLIDANELISSAELCSYFDACSIKINFSNNLSIKINASVIEFERNDFRKIFSNSAGLFDAELNSNDFVLQKDSEGLSII